MKGMIIMREISPKEIQRNTFNLIGNDWMLITAEKDSKVNTMTASWGGLGVFCNKDVAFTFIRPQRYTKEFVDDANTFSISVLPEKYRKELSYLGSVSGRDESKIENAGLTVKHENGTPYFEQANLVLICKKMCSTNLSADSFIQKELCEKYFPNGDFHTVYISEIVKVLTD